MSTHTQCGGEDRQRFSVSRSKLRNHRLRRLSQGKTQQWTSEQVVNSVEVKQSEIIKKTVSTFDKLAVVPIEIQSQDSQDCAEYEAWIRQ